MKKESGSITKQADPLILRRYRDAAGLSPQQLADFADVSKGFISARLRAGATSPMWAC